MATETGIANFAGLGLPSEIRALPERNWMPIQSGKSDLEFRRESDWNLPRVAATETRGQDSADARGLSATLTRLPRLFQTEPGEVMRAKKRV